MMYLKVLVPQGAFINPVAMDVVQPTNDNYALFQVTAAEGSTPLGIYWDLNGGKPLIWCYGIVAPLYLTSSYPATDTLYWQPDLAVASYWSWKGGVYGGFQFEMATAVMNLEQTAEIGVLDGNIVMGNPGVPMDFGTVFFLSSSNPPMFWLYLQVATLAPVGSLLAPTSSVYELAQVNFAPGATLGTWVSNDAVDGTSIVSCNRNVIMDDLEDNGKGIIFVDRRMYLAYNTEAPNEVFWQSTGGSKFMIETRGDGEVWNPDYTLTMGMLDSTVVMAGLYTPGFLQIMLGLMDVPYPPLGGAERPSRPQRTLGASQPVCPSTIRGGVGRGVPLSTAPAPECTHVASTSGGNLYFCPN